MGGNFYITVSNGLLKDDHRKRMGASVWEFMWCLDKVTKVDEDGTGWVLGGKPIKLADLAEQMGVDRNTVSENLSHLEKQEYITKKRTPYGLIIAVNKAKKRFGKNTDSGVGENADSNSAKTPILRTENADSNKTETVRHNSKTLAKAKEQTSYGNEDINKCTELLKSKLGGRPDGTIAENRRYCKLLLNRFATDYPGRDPTELVTALIEFGVRDEFHGKNATSFKYLYYHGQQIIQSLKNKKSQVAVI